MSADDGSRHSVEAFGEALDGGDKGTAKAMSAAYKSAMVQTFCIPVAENDDADAASHRLAAARTHAPEPVQGWAQWMRDIGDIVRSARASTHRRSPGTQSRAAEGDQP